MEQGWQSFPHLALPTSYLLPPAPTCCSRAGNVRETPNPAPSNPAPTNPAPLTTGLRQATFGI